jgi:lipase
LRLATRTWGSATAKPVVCLHGIGQHGGIYAQLGKRLAGEGRRVLALDLRGHGGSGHEPPWSLATHAGDVLETLDAEGIEAAAFVGHSFGGAVAAALSAAEPDRVERLALLDPGFGLPPDYVLKSAEMDRLDWSFGSVEGAVNALLAADTVVATPKETVQAFVAADLRSGVDGRLRFSHSPAAVVVAWSEMALPPPPIAQLPTLLVRPIASQFLSLEQDKRYRAELGPLLTLKAVPNGHNVLWESPMETTAAISDFLTAAGN